MLRKRVQMRTSFRPDHAEVLTAEHIDARKIAKPLSTADVNARDSMVSKLQIALKMCIIVLVIANQVQVVQEDQVEQESQVCLQKVAKQMDANELDAEANARVDQDVHV